MKACVASKAGQEQAVWKVKWRGFLHSATPQCLSEHEMLGHKSFAGGMACPGWVAIFHMWIWGAEQSRKCQHVEEQDESGFQKYECKGIWPLETDPPPPVDLPSGWAVGVTISPEQPSVEHSLCTSSTAMAAWGDGSERMGRSSPVSGT